MQVHARTIAPRYRNSNSATRIDTNSAVLCNMQMAPIEEIRRLNLVALVADHGGQRHLSDALGGKPSPAQLSQWINRSPDAKTGRPRTMSGDSARAIEHKLGLADNWMDAVHDPALAVSPVSRSELAAEHTTPQQSQRVRVQGVAMIDADGFWSELQESMGDEFVGGVLGNDPGAYAIRVVGRRYFPAIDSGQCIVVSPAAPLKMGRRVLVRLSDGRHAARIYLHHQDGLWVFASLTDANDVLELRDAEVSIVHRIAAVSDSDL